MIFLFLHPWVRITTRFGSLLELTSENQPNSACSGSCQSFATDYLIIDKLSLISYQWSHSFLWPAAISHQVDETFLNRNNLIRIFFIKDNLLGSSCNLQPPNDRLGLKSQPEKMLKDCLVIEQCSRPVQDTLKEKKVWTLNSSGLPARVWWPERERERKSLLLSGPGALKDTGELSSRLIK